MARPVPTKLYHFTHMLHLESIIRDGLVCDTDAHAPGRLTAEVGNLEVKQRRRSKAVDISPGGVVADYVPFYYCPRNLMLYQISTGRVPTYQGRQEGLVFLCTTLEEIIRAQLPWVVSDRNAATTLAQFTSDLNSLDRHVDWELATTSTFNRTPEDPDRPSRHQAELLVHRRLPWETVQFIGVRTSADHARVEATVAKVRSYRPRCDVRPGWYF